jgi:hypothetical protein
MNHTKENQAIHALLIWLVDNYAFANMYQTFLDLDPNHVLSNKNNDPSRLAESPHFAHYL